MEFTSIHQVDAEFYNLFLKHKSVIETILPDGYEDAQFIPISTHLGTVSNFLVRYYNKGGAKGYQDDLAYYPVISIMNFVPTVDPKRAIFVLPYVIGDIDNTPTITVDNPLGLTTASKIFFPAALDFVYQVSVACERESDIDAVTNWFGQNFQYYVPEPCFLLNEIKTAENGNLGVVVPYKMTTRDVLRTDGIFERIFEFTLKTYVHFRVPENDIIVQKINILIETGVGNIGELSQELIEKVEINFAQ